MIEWDEVNWRSGIGILGLALLLIAGSVFMVNDYMTSKRMKSDLEGQLTAINDFYRTWKPPSAKEQEEMRNQADSLQKELGKLSPRIGLEIDPAQVEEKIRGLAAATGVSLEKMELQPQTAEGFLKVYPMALTVKGVPEQLSRFMMGVGNLEVASRRGGNPAISGGQIEVLFEFLSFDQAAWNASYSCSLRVNPPQITETDLAKIKVFKDGLADLQSKVVAEKDNLAGVKKALSDKCELEKRISGLERQIKLSKDLAK